MDFGCPSFSPSFRHNFVPTQYFENKLIEFHQILCTVCIHIDKIYIGIVTHHFCTFVPELWPLIYAKISFPLIILRTIDRISPNFIYAFILTESTLGLLHIIVDTFVSELWPLVYAKISFPLNNLRTLLTKFHQIL